MLPFEKVSTLKGKNLLPTGANSFLLELTPFQKGFAVQESKQEATMVVSPLKMAENLPSICMHYVPFSQLLQAR